MTAPSLAVPKATLDDLLKADGKAELIGGRIITFMASGDLPSFIAFEIAVYLRLYGKQTGRGTAYGDGIGFVVSELPSGRESFSPDAAFYTGPRPKNRMRFIEGAPIFAVEVRSENDYTAKSLREQAAKRADYFAAGTLVVWDVDPLGECIHVYRSAKPGQPETFKFGTEADAEPALPGFKVKVESLWE